MQAAACCPPNSIESKGETALMPEQPVGRVETILTGGGEQTKNSKMECYMTGTPLPEARRIVLIFTDVFGYKTGNHRVVADRLGSSLESTAVLIPDFFHGNPVLKYEHVISWFSLLPQKVRFLLFVLPQVFWNCKFRVTDKAITNDLLEAVLPWIRDKLTDQNKLEDVGISCVGFCFGGWQTAYTLALANQENLSFFHCGVGIHPSFRIERIHGRTEGDLARQVGTQPLLLLPAGNDELQPRSHEAIQILAHARGVSEEEIAINFPSMIHGWVTRGDPADKEVKKEQERALTLTVEFIEANHPIK